MHEQDDGPSDPGKVRATISAALASGLITLQFRAATDANGVASIGGHSNTEAEAVARAESLNCPACGGSGHIGDLNHNSNIHDRVLEILPETPLDVIAIVVHAVAETLAMPDAITALTKEIADSEEGFKAVTDALARQVAMTSKLERKLADMTTNRDALDEACQRKDKRIEELQQTPAVTHSNRPEVEILIAGRHDLMVEIEKRSDDLRALMQSLSSYTTDAEDNDIRETIRLLDRLGAYIVGQDTRLIAAGDALAEANRLTDEYRERVVHLSAKVDEERRERDAAVIDRDKADAAHGKAARDYRAALTHAMDAGAQLAAEVEGLKGDVRAAEKAWDDEQAKRVKADKALKDAELHSAMLEMRIEAAIHELRIGADPMSIVDYLTPALQPGKSRTAPGRGTYTADDLAYLGEILFQTAQTLGTKAILDKGEDGERHRPAFVEAILRAHGLRTPTEEKPRCRVVTSPRFYGVREETVADIKLERWQFEQGFHTRRIMRLELIETIAAVLGMRKAAQ